MKIMIEIGNEHYERIMRLEEGVTVYPTTLALYEAVKNGTPLPKGHGALKDADVMINRLCTNEASEFFGSITCAEFLDFIEGEKTIIEADKGE